MFPGTKDLVKRYPPSDRCLLYESAMDYAFTGAEPDWPHDDFKWYAWDLLKTKVDAAERAKENGRLAGLVSAERRRNTAQQTATTPNTPSTGVEHHSNTPSTDPQLKVEVEEEVKVEDKVKKGNRRFTPPTRDEVAAYIAEKGYSVDPDHWMAHYESNGWKVGSNPMKDWRAAVRTWARNDMNRPRQDQPRKVIAQQYTQREVEPEWHNDLVDYLGKEEGTA